MINQAATGHATNGLPRLIVNDTRMALGQLASCWRSHFDIPLVALTGSSGKTTVKEMLASILRSPGHGASLTEVLATEGNLNNDIGVPLMLFKLRPRHAYAVIEMGMNHAGEISYLTHLARPDVAMINNAGSAHLAGLGSLEAIARAKGEILEALNTTGVAVLNRDDTFFSLWRELAGDRRVIDFGLNTAATVNALVKAGPETSELTLRTPFGETVVQLRVPGIHNVKNALAAAAGAMALNIPLPAIAQGLANYRGIKGRLQLKPCLLGAKLIDDTYNANPESVRAAISVLAATPNKKILVLGDMGELGSQAETLHAAMGAEAKRAGVDILFTLGELSVAASKAFGKGAQHFERIQELLAEIENLLAPNVTLLVKGSRFMQMERVVKSFVLTEENYQEVANGDYRH